MSLTDWRTDWVYALVFREAEKAWQWCNPAPGEVGRFVLLEEYSSADDSLCGGEVIRAWVRNAAGLQEIGLEEHQMHLQELEKDDPYPLVLFQFHVRPSRKGVVIGTIHGAMCGSGTGYLVEGEGAAAVLTPDPEAGFWVA
jgi:hypothetical protein